MESLNKVELVGVVGAFRTTTVGDTTFADFSMATNRAYRDKDGTAVIETTWHNVHADTGHCNKDLCRGAGVHVWGRLQPQRYTDQDGNDRTVMRVLAQTVAVLPDGTGLADEE